MSDGAPHRWALVSHDGLMAKNIRGHGCICTESLAIILQSIHCMLFSTFSQKLYDQHSQNRFQSYVVNMFFHMDLEHFQRWNTSHRPQPISILRTGVLTDFLVFIPTSLYQV